MTFKEYRESKRISPVNAARQLDVSYQTIWRWENGRALPTPTQRLRIQDWSDGAVLPDDWCQSVPSGSKVRKAGSA